MLMKIGDYLEVNFNIIIKEESNRKNNNGK